MSAFVQEHLAGVRVVRAYAQEAAETRTFHGLDAGYQERNMSLARAQGVFNPLLSLLGGVGAIIALVLGGRSVINGQITEGAFVAFTIYLATLIWPMIALGWAISLLQRGDAATDRIDALFRDDVRYHLRSRTARPSSWRRASGSAQRALREGVVPLSRSR